MPGHAKASMTSDAYADHIRPPTPAAPTPGPIRPNRNTYRHHQLAGFPEKWRCPARNLLRFRRSFKPASKKWCVSSAARTQIRTSGRSFPASYVTRGIIVTP
jgi:hypothetical protein